MDIYEFLNKDLYRITSDGNAGSGSSDVPSAPDESGGTVFADNITTGELDGGITLTGGFLQSKNFVSGSAGWQLTPTSGEFNFTVSVDSIDIPDTTTANSFHVESDGDTWWGANVATGYTGANAYVLKDGTAVFKSLSIGGTSIQYTITDNGYFSYGDGSDGAATITNNTTLTADKYYTNLTINNSATLNPGGYRIFVSGTLTVGGASAGTVARNGVAGGNGGDGEAGQAGLDPGSGGSAGTAGTALADGYLKGSVAGKAGSGGSGGASGNPGHGSAGGNGTAGEATANSIGASGTAGGGGGAGGADNFGGNGGAASSGGGAGTATASNVKLIANWHLATLLDIGSTGTPIKYDNSAGSGSGGGAGGGGGNAVNGNGGAGGGGGGGGGSGSCGGIVAIYARIIVINSNGSITSNGGAGGNGGNGGNGHKGTDDRPGGGGGTGGGGAGGNGGQIILVYNSLTNSGTLTASAGAAGTKGATVGTGTVAGGGYSAGADGSLGSDGTAGTAGTIRQFQLSL